MKGLRKICMVVSLIYAWVLLYPCSVAAASGTMPVSVTYLGETQEYRTSKKLVSDVLYELGFKITDDDQVSPGLTEVIEPGDNIVILSIAVQEITTQEFIPYQTIERANPELPSGTRRTIQEGKNGVCEILYRATYCDEELTDLEIVQKALCSEAVDEIIEYGTKPVFALGVIPEDKNFAYTRVEQFEATAYTVDNGGKSPSNPYYGMTAWGVRAQYGVIAVDPNVIPYGTKMYIESADGKYIYGYCVAGDCGSAIKGKKVDLFFNTSAECYSFGRRAVNIYFLAEPPAERWEIG